MGDFFTPPPNYPPPPEEPSYSIPNFAGIGEDLGKGLAGSGALGGLFSGLFEILVKFVTWGLGWLLRISIKIVAKIFNIMGDVTDEASIQYGDLVAAMMKDLFGIDVDPASVNTRRAGPDRQVVANKLGQTIIGTFFSAVQKNPGAGITPSDAAANNFLAVMMNMELNGWVEGWFADAVSYHLLEKWGELKDGLTRVLGLGRMSRQVFAPPLKVFVHDPYLALLEQKYRTKQIPEQVLLRAFYNGEIPRDRLSKVLGDQGYSEQYIEWIISQHAKFLPDADVDYLVSRGIWTTDDAQVYLQEQGWDLNNAQHLIAVMADKRIHKYALEMVAAAQDAFVKGDIPFDQWQHIVLTAGLTDEEQTWIIRVAGMKREFHITHLSLGQIEQGILEGVLNLGDLKAWATRAGMPADEEAFLELMVLFKQNKQTHSEQAKAAAAAAKATAASDKLKAAAAKAAEAKAQAADKGISVSEAETLVKDGLWTFDHLQTYLAARGYSSSAIDSIVALLHAAMAKTSASQTAAAGTRAAAAAKGLSLGQVEKAVIAGILTGEDLQKYLAAHGFDAADAQVVVELAQEAADAAKTKEAAKAAATAKAAAKQISLPELERAVRLGLTPMATYDAALKTAGFDALSITLLDGILSAQIAADKATADKRAAGANAPTSKGITLQQLEQEVLDGIRPISDYSAELAKLGYAPLDQTDLTALLQLKLDQAKATAAKQAAAGNALKDRGISIADAERAVKLGVVPISVYTQLLQKAGFTKDAVDVLTATLLAQVAATAKAQNSANGAAVQLAKKSISLPDLERAVVAGLQPIETYSATLSQQGYSAEDVGTLTDLLQLKVDQAARAAALHADALGAPTQKGLSLGQEEAAIIAGDLTMQDYDAFLSALGYDDVDRATLEDLLQARLTAKASKAGAGGSGPPGGAGGGSPAPPSP